MWIQSTPCLQFTYPKLESRIWSKNGKKVRNFFVWIHEERTAVLEWEVPLSSLSDGTIAIGKVSEQN